MEQQKLNLQSHLQRTLEMYIAVEPFVYDTSQVKYISSVLLHWNVYIFPCFFFYQKFVSIFQKKNLWTLESIISWKAPQYCRTSGQILTSGVMVLVLKKMQCPVSWTARTYHCSTEVHGLWGLTVIDLFCTNLLSSRILKYSEWY